MNPGLVLIGLAAWLWYRTRSSAALLPPPPAGGTTDPTGQNTGTANQYQVWIAETENPAWTWTTRPAIFNEVPLSPGSRQRWFDLNKLYQDISETNLEYYALQREFDEYQREGRGAAEAENSPEWAAVKARRAQLDKSAKDLAELQRTAESNYKRSLQLRFSADQIAQFYQTRADQIMAGIWPAQETLIVPAVNGGSIPTGPGSGGPGGGTPEFDAGMGGKRVPFAKYYVQSENLYTVDDVWNKHTYRQTGKQGWANRQKDAKRKALPPGKRISAAGNVYYERRRNRSDRRDDLNQLL